VTDPVIVCCAMGWGLSSEVVAAAVGLGVLKVMCWFVVMSRLLLLSALLCVSLIHVCLIGMKASAKSVIVGLVLSS